MNEQNYNYTILRSTIINVINYTIFFSDFQITEPAYGEKAYASYENVSGENAPYRQLTDIQTWKAADSEKLEEMAAVEMEQTGHVSSTVSSAASSCPESPTEIHIGKSNREPRHHCV